MKNILKVVLLILLPAGFAKVNAQIVTKRDSINGNEFTIIMDKRIDDVIASMENEMQEKSLSEQMMTPAPNHFLKQKYVRKILGF